MTVEDSSKVKLLGLQIRAQRAGILSDKIQIGDGSIETPIRFMEKLKRYNRAVELKPSQQKPLHSWTSEEN